MFDLYKMYSSPITNRKQEIIHMYMSYMILINTLNKRRTVKLAFRVKLISIYPHVFGFFLPKPQSLGSTQSV